MNTTFTRALARLAVILSLGLATIHSAAQVPDAGTVWRYQLIDGSQLVDDCPVCDRIPIVMPLRGSFDLRCLGHDPLYSHYKLENVTLLTTATNGLTYKVNGQGWLDIGGELAVRQTLYLEAIVYNGVNSVLCHFTNTSPLATRLWPMLAAGLEQTNGTLVQQFHIDLNAAPFQEIWFSSVGNFVAGTWNPPTNTVSAGDLISSAGRIVKRNYELSYRLGIMPPAPDIGLKDIDILAGGEIAFSLERGQFSETLGRSLRPGDLLSNRGKILKTSEQLLASFEPEPPLAAGAGLDAVKLLENGQAWFSVQTNFYSKALARTVESGDLLADTGTLLRSNASLIEAFQPLEGTGDVGLRAFHVWPGGEIWFVTEKRFGAANAASYAPGDLLSDSGYVVYRASELLERFAPADGAQDPEVDALFVVTDVNPAKPSPELNAPQPTNAPPASLVLRWQGSGRVFQLERSTSPANQFDPASTIIPDLSFVDPGAQTNDHATFYRLRQW